MLRCAGSASAHGGSNFGFLSQEAFAFRFFFFFEMPFLYVMFLLDVLFRCFRSFRFGIAFACRISEALRLLDSQPFSLEGVTALPRSQMSQLAAKSSTLRTLGQECSYAVWSRLLHLGWNCCLLSLPVLASTSKEQGGEGGASDEAGGER